ncbi:MAG: YqeG family HAD IIIA-type phosphatase [Thermaceae bacterium]
MLRPKALLSRLTQLTPEYLTSRGLKGIILDIDNTLLPYEAKEIPREVSAWLESLKRAGIPIYLLSNTKPSRFRHVQALLNLPGHAPALKPWFGFRRAIRALGLKPEEVAVVGDQVFTDVLGGNLAGAYTILVPPLAEQEFFYTRFIRLLEAPFRRMG